MDDNQLEAFKHMTIIIGIVVPVLAIIIWFVFIVQSGLERTRLKHETCMIENTTSVNGSVTVLEYCGPKEK